MRKDLTEIVMVVDRSGSMHSMKDDAEGGINQLVKDQQEVDGDANLTLIQFDTTTNVIYDGTPIEHVKPYTLKPGGMTALLDAVGLAITETKARIKAMKKADRPGLVVFVIVTDGHENSSREFDLPKIKKMIEKQQGKKWHFTFLGANIDAFAAGGSMGVRVASTMQYSPLRAKEAYQGTSETLTSARIMCMSGGEAKMEFTAEQLAAAKGANDWEKAPADLEAQIKALPQENKLT